MKYYYETVVYDGKYLLRSEVTKEKAKSILENCYDNVERLLNTPKHYTMPNGCGLEVLKK